MFLHIFHVTFVNKSWLSSCHSTKYGSIHYDNIQNRPAVLIKFQKISRHNITNFIVKKFTYPIGLTNKIIKSYLSSLSPISIWYFLLFAQAIKSIYGHANELTIRRALQIVIHPFFFCWIIADIHANGNFPYGAFRWSIVHFAVYLFLRNKACFIYKIIIGAVVFFSRVINANILSRKALALLGVYVKSLAFAIM